MHNFIFVKGYMLLSFYAVLETFREKNVNVEDSDVKNVVVEWHDVHTTF
jgi:hypothetical protein